MVLRPLPAPFPATVIITRSSRMPTSHLRSNMLAPRRIMPGFQRHDHSSQIPAKALDPPPAHAERADQPAQRARTLADAHLDECPQLPCGRDAPSHIASTRAAQQILRERHAQPEQNIQQWLQGSASPGKTRHPANRKHRRPCDAPDQPPAERGGPERRRRPARKTRFHPRYSP